MLYLLEMKILFFFTWSFYKNSKWWVRHFKLKVTIMDTFIPIYEFLNLSLTFKCYVWRSFDMNELFASNFDEILTKGDRIFCLDSGNVFERYQNSSTNFIVFATIWLKLYIKLQVICKFYIIECNKTEISCETIWDNSIRSFLDASVTCYSWILYCRITSIS